MNFAYIVGIPLFGSLAVLSLCILLNSPLLTKFGIKINRPTNTLMKAAFNLITIVSFVFLSFLTIGCAYYVFSAVG